MTRRLAVGLLAAAALAPPVSAAEPDWSAIRGEALRLLSGYVQIDTTNPPGHEMPGARYLKRFFEAEGIPCEIYSPSPDGSRGNLVARLAATRPAPGGPGPILLLSHIDVVPADPAAWSSPPFSGALSRDAGGHEVLYGRGALDDKGHGVAHALALALLHRQGAPLDRDIVFAATSSEEAGFDTGADWMVEHHWDALGPPVAVWNEGGVSLPSPMVGGRVLNAIATDEKRALWMTLVATGKSGHGSQPIPGAAVDRLVAALHRIESHPTPLHVTPTAAETFAGVADAVAFPLDLALRNVSNPLVLRLAGRQLEESRLTNAMVRDTIAFTGLRAGRKHNVIPGQAEAMLDVRLLPDTDATDFLAWLREVIDDPSIELRLEPDGDETAFRTWRQRVLGNPDAPVPASPTDNELFRALARELAAEFPDSISVPLLDSGGSDSKWFRARGVPAYGYVPALLDEELVATMHGVDERLPAGELERAIRIEYRTLLELSR